MTTHPLSAHVLLVDINMEDIIAQLAATAGMAAVVGIPQSSSTNVAAGGIGSRKGGSSPRGTSGRNLMDILEVARERWLTVRRCACMHE